jgi:hypothetical protein
VLNTPHWPRAGTAESPWVAGEKWRGLQLIVDDVELPHSPALDLLATFARHRNPLAFVSPAATVGGSIEFTGENEVRYAFLDQGPFLTGNPTQWWRRSAAEEAATVDDLDVGILERRLRLLDEARRNDWIDGLVMPFDPRLRDRWRRPIERAPLLTVEQAIALSGLFLRACGERMIEVEPSGTGIMVNEERLYLLGATNLLSDFEILWEGAGRRWSAVGDPTLMSLVDAVAIRMGRALKARDYLHVRRRANLHEVWPEVLYFFESVLVCLQGAADSAARLVRAVFDIKGSRMMANWGRREWWSALQSSDAPDREFDRECLEDVDVLVGDLRNSIHGEVLTGELRRRVEPGEVPLLGGHTQHTVALESELGKAVALAAVRRGGTGRWAIRATLPDGAALIDPWRYADAAIATTGEALSSVLSALAGTRGFVDLEVHDRARDIFLGRGPQRQNASLLFGVEKLPPLPSRLP